MTEIRVSVIVPTYQDWPDLQKCLSALAEQTFPAEAFEILPKNAKIIDVLDPGSYAARNAAIGMSKAKLLAFTDADCIPTAEWLATAVDIFDTQASVMRIAGGVEMFVEHGKWTTLALYDRTYMLRQDRFSEVGKAATANAFSRRAVFDAIGLFDPQLLTGGDHEWSIRAENAGYSLLYCPKAAIRHPARASLLGLLRKARRFAGGTIARKRKRGDTFVIPHFDNLFIPIRRGVLLLRSDELSLWEAMRVWIVLYAIRIVIVIEQIRLVVFRGQYERR